MSFKSGFERERESQFNTAGGSEFQVRGAAVLNDRLANDVRRNWHAQQCDGRWSSVACAGVQILDGVSASLFLKNLPFDKCAVVSSCVCVCVCVCVSHVLSGHSKHLSITVQRAVQILVKTWSCRPTTTSRMCWANCFPATRLADKLTDWQLHWFF